MYRSFFKRVMDIMLSIIGLAGASPIFLFITAGLFISNNGKPFFFQRRPGKDGKIFKVVKFKTMNDRRDKGGNLLPDSERLTAIGSFVRRSSLDEIPQLINVLKGDMSLIGPRPLLVEYLPLYDEVQRRRHEVRPGITGWAQVNGRNAISWEEKFKFDVWYVDNRGFSLDLKILLLTMWKVIKAQDVNTGKDKTMGYFTGSR